MGQKSLLFFDTLVGKIDSKGRVCIPASYRSSFEKTETDLVVFRSFNKPCIECCSSLLLENLAQGIEDTLSLFSEEQETLADLIYADAHAFVFDSTGRIGLSQKLISHASLTDTVAFVGKGRTFQIWNPELYEKENNLIRQKALSKKTSLPVFSLRKKEQ